MTTNPTRCVPYCRIRRARPPGSVHNGEKIQGRCGRPARPISLARFSARRETVVVLRLDVQGRDGRVARGLAEPRRLHGRRVAPASGALPRVAPHLAPGQCPGIGPSGRRRTSFVTWFTPTSAR